MIETVGVGQSETVVAQMSDLFLLLLAPAGGDELQGVKRGIMEMADILLINKADGDLKHTAMRTCADYAGALRLMRKRAQDPDGFPQALMVSALDGSGVATAWDVMQTLITWRKDHGVWDQTRGAQASYWFHEEVRQQLLAQLSADPATASAIEILGKEVSAGRMSPTTAATAALRNLKSGH